MWEVVIRLGETPCGRACSFYFIPGLVLVTVVRARNVVPVADSAWSRAGDPDGSGLGVLTGSILGLVTGWGLLQREPWARTLAIVMACMNLVFMPFGMMLGLYTLWVLLPATSEREYHTVARAA